MAMSGMDTRLGRRLLPAVLALALAGCGTQTALNRAPVALGALGAKSAAPTIDTFVTQAFTRADSDRDDSLSGPESGLDAAQFRALDGDSSGELSRDEWTREGSLADAEALLPAFRPMVEEVRKRLDANRDLRVSAGEAARAAGDVGASRHEPLGLASVSSAMRRADADGDGQLTGAEFDRFYLQLGQEGSQDPAARGFFGKLVNKLLGGYLSVTSGIAAKQAFHPTRTMPSVTPAKLNLPFEEVSFKTEDGLTLRGWFIPAATPSADTVIGLHGISACRDTFVRQGQVAMLNAKYNQLVFDLRNHGQSEGTHTSFGYHEGKDVQAAVRYLAGRGLTSVAVYGMSLGGATAIRAGALIPSLKGVVDDCTYATVQYAMTGFISRTFIPAPAMIAAATLERGNRDQGIDMASTEPITQVGRLAPRPLLIIHGTADINIAPENSRLIYQMAGGPNKTLWFAPGGTHAHSAVDQPEAYKAHLLTFFNQAFGGETPPAPGLPMPGLGL